MKLCHTMRMQKLCLNPWPWLMPHLCLEQLRFADVLVVYLSVHFRL